MEHEMAFSPFVTAFYAGLTSPLSIYAPHPAYEAYAQIPSPAVSFAVVGARLGAMAGQLEMASPNERSRD